jgi:hypothetical protein
VRGIGVAVSVRTSTSARSAFSAFLLAHAEPVLLVDDDEPEARELHFAPKQLVRTDRDIDAALGKVLYGLRLLSSCLEA